MSIIAFTGVMGCGKTTAARILCGYDLSFAKPLKEAVKILFLLTEDQLYTQAGKNTVDPRWGVTPREFLQWMGTDVIRKRFPGHWVQLMEHRIRGLHDRVGKQALITVDDIRFEDEAELIRKLGGVVVHIVGRKAEVEDHTADHKSEQGIMFMTGDEVIDNSGTTEELQGKLRRFTDYERTTSLSEEDYDAFIDHLTERNDD
jgi:hypothetical protein